MAPLTPIAAKAGPIARISTVPGDPVGPAAMTNPAISALAPAPTFVAATCRKAGLAEDAVERGASLGRFEAIHFAEGEEVG